MNTHLSTRLSLVLFALLFLMSISFALFAINSAPLFLQELNQQVNRELANNIVKEKKLINNREVNQEALSSIFMGLMLVNPLIEVYLTDMDGKLLAYSAPEGVVKLDRIQLNPIRQYLDGKAFPIRGSDPRNPGQQKVFSAAPIYHGQQQEGFLYIILGGQAYDSVMEMLQSSYVMRVWFAAIAASLLVTLITGVIIMRHVTRRLVILHGSMAQFKKSNFTKPVQLPKRFDGRPGDEIDQLGANFREMSERIDQQLKLLQHADASRRELIANVSHDLRTPLASMQGYLETLTLKTDSLSETEKQQYLNIAYQHSKQLGKLIAELFELATLENHDPQLHFEAFSMAELAQDVCQKFQLDARNKDLVLKNQIPPQAAFVSADISLIQRVLENLIENAIKYTQPGGEINLNLDVSDNVIRTSIEDSGSGIPSEELPHIFNRFYRVEKHRNTEGTGLGLAIAKRIIQLHQSAIQVQSQPGQGTRFSFDLPAFS